MDWGGFFNSGIYIWLILPLTIFLARICDVTIGTIRIIFVSKGQKKVAACLGFFEVLIWIVAIGQIMKNLNNPACYIGYAGGFAMGNFIGITIEGKLAMGMQVIRIFTNYKSAELADSLRRAGFGVTVLDGHGITGPVSLIYTVIKRSSLPEAERIIKELNPKAFYSIEELRSVNAGVFPAQETGYSGGFNLLRQKFRR